MRRRVKRGFSLFVVMIMQAAMLSVSTMAKETTTSGSTVVQQNSVSIESAITQATVAQTVNGGETIAALEYQGFQYREETAGITLISYNGKLNETKILEIPEKINDKTVIKIEKAAFKDNLELKEAIIPKGVITIDKTAFDGCTGLEKITVDQENTIFYDLDGKLYGRGKEVLILKPTNWQEIKTVATEEQNAAQETDSDQIAEPSQTFETKGIENGFEYTEYNGGVIMIKYTGPNGDVAIPSMLGGKKCWHLAILHFQNVAD